MHNFLALTLTAILPPLAWVIHPLSVMGDDVNPGRHEITRRASGLQQHISVSAPNAVEPLPITVRHVSSVEAAFHTEGPGTTTLSWYGLLQGERTGAYRFAAKLRGELKLIIDDQILINTSSEELAWIESEPIVLNHADHGLHIELCSSPGPSQLALFWSGPGFDFEPVPASQLFHVEPLIARNLAETTAATPETDHAADVLVGPIPTIDTLGDEDFETGLEAEKGTDEITDEQFADRNLGAEWTRALRCSVCHQDIETTPLRSPSLEGATRHLSPPWLITYLSRPERISEPRSSHDFWRHFHQQWSSSEAQQLTAFLNDMQSPELTNYQRDASTQESMTPSDTPLADPTRLADAVAGRTHIVTLGCLGCHQLNGLGSDRPLGGEDFASLSTKRTEAFFERWLQDPASLNPQHRMPIFDLSRQECRQIASYLASLSSDRHKEPAASFASERHSVVPAQTDRGPVATGIDGGAVVGAAIFQAARCSDCHQTQTRPRGADGGETPKSGAAIAPTTESARTRPWKPPGKLGAQSDWNHSCLLNEREDRPNFGIVDASLRNIIQDHLLENRFPGRDDLAEAARTVADHNCLGCHAREAALGLRPTAMTASETVAGLVDAFPDMLPPSLNGVGDKLHTDGLVGAILRRHEPRRPWLRVRMPRFQIDQVNAEAIANYFVLRDRVPDEATQPWVPQRDDLPVAQRLVTSDGFGCTSCHAIGKSQPQQAPRGGMAPNLSNLGSHVRRIWFDRWVRNPARIIPRMEMPSVQIAVPGVLDGDLDRQLAGVWGVLNQPGFQPPDPQPVRVVGIPESAAMNETVAHTTLRANVLTDVLQHRGQTYVKPFLIGLANRQNVLFDLQEGELVAWWSGDTARQRTRGKSWFWESPSMHDRTTFPGTEIMLDRAGLRWIPQRQGQFVVVPDEWSKLSGGVRWRHRLHFYPGESEVVLSVEQDILPIGDGWKRTLTIRGMQPSDRIAWVPSWEGHPAMLAGELLEGDSSGQPDGAPVVTLVGRDSTRSRTATVLAPNAQGVLSASVLYPPGPTTPPQQVQTPPTDRVDDGELAAEGRPHTLPVLHGFTATRLPVPAETMPIAFAWKPDGTLVFASLKGRVWLASDSDGDRFEDTVRPISDELAAPYGLHAESDYVLVVTKYGLVRIWDSATQENVGLHEVVAAGWGHTDDYHDWAVGLPRDDQGNFYVAIPCQQDDRSVAAAHLRGSIVRLVPVTPTQSNPHLFDLEQVSSGHRFPMGLARNRQGTLVVTDNQGNFNPFNELNCVIEGAHYGFINKLERRAGFRPELTPPAIDIPHPWTRSVNGICFLETEDRRYGPFEGQLVGCEYDTRRLIRMSLENIDGVLQGAAYPWSYLPEHTADGLLGPIACGLAPNGDLYVGGIRDSGWGGANNTGEIVQIQPKLEQLPAGIAEVRATHRGFQVAFTRPVDQTLGRDASNYFIESYRRISTPEYGGDDVDRRSEAIVRVELDDDGRRVELQIESLREGFVYELRLKSLVQGDALFFPDEAHYTLRTRPTAR